MYPLNIMYSIFCVLLKVISGVADNADNADTTINIDVNTTQFSTFHHFWKSTGFCPPDPKENIPNYLLSDEQKINIALIGSLPNNAISHVRIHWVLNLLTISSRCSETSYNFTLLDKFLLHLHHLHLMPSFEFMGYSNRFVEFEKSKHFWKKLVNDIATRYIDQLGIEEVSQWRFETWNEPDLGGYNVLNFTVSEYLDYVNGCFSGLEEAFSKWNVKAKLGGPAGLFGDKNHPLCWGLLETCNRLKTCPLSFISFHRKGGGSAIGVLNGSFELLDKIYDRFPRLKKMPIANDEADIQEDWSESLEWRGDSRYAAMVVRVVAGYHESIGVRRGLKIEVLSNDNGFLNYHPFYFTQRTLFARFQMNATSPPHSQFIRKPAYSVMSLLSLLGDELLAQSTQPDPLLTVVATRRGPTPPSFVSVILAYGNETQTEDGATRVINVVFRNMETGDRRFVIYRLDNVHTNPYRVWKGFGRPVFPTRYQRRKMRRAEEPTRLIYPTTVTDSTLNVSLQLTIPSIHLINICSKPRKSPANVYSVTIFNVTWNEVLIIWKYKGSYVNCLRTFEVENQSKCSGKRRFKRINRSDTIFMSFHHVGKADRGCEWTRGDYRVRATDDWKRSGSYSRIIEYP